MGKYPDSGALWNNEKSSSKQPDMTGSVEISRELAKEIHDQLKENGEASIRLAAWWNAGRKGNFLSVKVSAPMKKKPEPQLNQDMDDEIPF